MSAGRTTPRTVITWFSELTRTVLLPSTTRNPLGRTSTTRAVMVVVRVVVREVVPEPSRLVLPDVVRIFDNLPGTENLPAAELADTDKSEFLAVFVAPVETADAISLTSIVSMSSTRRARKSLEMSMRAAAPDHNDPGLSTGAASAALCACSTY